MTHLRSLLVLALSVAILGSAANLTAAAGDKDKQPSLKLQRDLADAFMRKAAEESLENLKNAKGAKAKENEKAIAELQKRLKGKRFFPGGSEKELAQFTTLIEEADKAKVKVGGDGLIELIRAEVRFGVDEKALKKIEKAVLEAEPSMNSESLMRAVANEFRARIMRDLSKPKTKAKT